MRSRPFLAAAIPLAMALVMAHVAAQGTPSGPPAQGAPAAPGGQGGRGGGVFPAQQRPPADPALVERGKGLFGVNCGSCHGPDARGGDQGGPNLLRSQLVLNDQFGELIGPVVLEGRADTDMKPIPLLPDEIKAVAAYLHALAAAGRGRGTAAPLNILVGNASAGQAVFTAKCASCHSPTGDLKGLASRIPDPKTLQNFWVSGGGGGGRGGAVAPSNVPPTTVTVTLPSGLKAEGRLVKVDDFIVILAGGDGVHQTFRRDGDTPNVEVHDPLEPHKKMLPLYTDRDIHDVTAYLVTLK